MRPTALLLGVPGAGFGEAVARACDAPLERLSLDAAFDADALVLRTDRDGTSLSWQGVELIARSVPRVSAVLVERPLFAWPQPWTDRVPPLEPEAAAQAVARLHAARSLTASALRVLSDRVPTANPAEAALLASAPGVALARLERAGIALHPWSLLPAGAPAPPDGLERDVLGRERWCAPAPAPDAPRLVHDPVAGAVHALLVLGDATAARARFADAGAWCRGELERAVSDDVDPATEPLDRAAGPLDGAARAAAAALGLPLAAVALVPGTRAGEAPAVLAVDPAPDLARWDALARGAVARAAGAWLASYTLHRTPEEEPLAR